MITHSKPTTELKFTYVNETEHPDYAFAKKTLVENFPENEYRELKAWQNLIRESKLYRLQVIFDKASRPLAILGWWEFNRFIYIEHFAIDKQYQGLGLGSSILARFIQLHQKSILLEVELPEDEQTKRRVKFYQALGFHLLPYTYVQPNYRNPSEKGIPMRIMIHGLQPDEHTFESLVGEVRKGAYGR